MFSSAGRNHKEASWYILRRVACTMGNITGEYAMFCIVHVCLSKSVLYMALFIFRHAFLLPVLHCSQINFTINLLWLFLLLLVLFTSSKCNFLFQVYVYLKKVEKRQSGETYIAEHHAQRGRHHARIFYMFWNNPDKYSFLFCNFVGLPANFRVRLVTLLRDVQEQCILIKWSWCKRTTDIEDWRWAKQVTERVLLSGTRRRGHDPENPFEKKLFSQSCVVNL